MAKNARPIPGSRAESLLDQLLTEVKGLRADLAKGTDAPLTITTQGGGGVLAPAVRLEDGSFTAGTRRG